MKKHLVLVLLVLCTAGAAAAYTRLTLSGGGSPRYTTLPVQYWINEKGFSQIPNGSEFNAVHSAFETWRKVSIAALTVQYMGTTPALGVGRDGMNVISFADGSTPLGSTTIAATFSFFKSGSGGTITDEADIIFNTTAFSFSTSGESGKYDIQSVLTHEVGHLLGLDHSALVSSVMAPFAALSVIAQRTLMYDDMAGIAEIYPNAAATAALGQIRGFVRSGTAAVFGAHVVAITGDGTPVVSALSQPDGSYTIRFLLPGAYRVYAEPMDLPVIADNVGGGSTSWYRNLNTDFGTTYLGNVAEQSAGSTVQVSQGVAASADIQVLPKGTTGLNLTRPAFGVRVARGVRGTLRIGGEDLTAGAGFSASDPSIVLGAPAFGGSISSVASTSATFDITVASSAPLGPKNITVTRNADSSILSGGLVITDVLPSSIQVAPASGASDIQTPVTITGSNFWAGAQVYFGGLPASDIRIIDSGTILATSPRNAPGVVNVQVVNADGTAGVTFQAFTYTASLPLISRVSPLSGSPITRVLIEGEHFDSRIQNIEVRFNGVPARVASATANSIETAVPFGATSGPITVTAFGQTATGPVFTVTAAAATSNIATSSYSFTDASAPAGGTNMTFSGVDDAVAFTTLPFSFSLFQDIYLAGSQISITTNGWLSLEAISNTEFQNAPLPGTTVSRPVDGSTGSVPESLIAAFWDDLIVRPGISTVSTRTVGSAPNRRFLVQWSNMSILDEVGTDLNASLTFQAILFEGSNDIQFVYQSMAGPRSDGSSATIGLQNLKRIKAVQTGFNQAIAGNGKFFTYRFNGGDYVTAAMDTSAPGKPVVVDGGAMTSSTTQLSASWTAEDAESGIREFQYAIGTAQGATDVRGFASTAQNSVVATGLSLRTGALYYFSVRAVNNAGLTSETGFSDGILVEPAFQPSITVIPSSPHGGNVFSGIALFAPVAMSAVMKAFDNSGNLILGTGIRNPATISLAAGQQYARMIPGIFGFSSFDGWIEIEASASGLGVYTATGTLNLQEMDGSVARELSSDFVFFHSGATAVLVNPSTRTANLTITDFGSTTSRLLTIPARGRVTTNLAGNPIRIRSSEPLAAIEKTNFTNSTAGIGAAALSSEAAQSLVFPHGVVGAGYSSTLTLVNVSNTPQGVSVSFGSASRTTQLAPNAAIRLSLADFLQLSSSTLQTGAVRVTASFAFGSSNALLGALDIESPTGFTILNPLGSVTEATFVHAAQGGGWYTGIAIATGSTAANMVVDVYSASGGAPRSASLTVGANQQVAKVLSELVPGVTTQIGGYIKIRSDQPVWIWGTIGSAEMIAALPRR